MLVTDSRGLQNYSFDEAKEANKVHLHNSMVYLNENKNLSTITFVWRSERSTSRSAEEFISFFVEHISYHICQS